jgi:hypothetical protein
LSTRRLADAEAHFETAATLEPTNQLYELNLAVIRLGMTNAAKAIQSRAALEKMRTDRNLGPAALRALVVDRLAHQDAAAANSYSIELLASPQANLADQLQQLGILQQLKSGDFAARLQSVQRLAATNAPALASVAAWMRANHLPAESLTWLTGLPDGARAQSPVRLALADGYLQSSDWPKLRDFASQGNWDEMEFLRRALVSRAWSQLGVRQVAESNWGSAVTEAGSRFGALTTLLGLAEQWKLPREQADLLQRMVAQFPRERWAQQALKQAQHSLEQLYLAAGNTAALNQLYAKLFSIFPQDAEIKNNLAATCLLLKTNLPQACQWATEVYAGTTNDRVVASTYAFALHLQGRTKEGLAILRKLDGRLLQQPDIALYYGVLLAATGATNEAAPFLQIARNNNRLLPEEKQLLEQAGPAK